MVFSEALLFNLQRYCDLTMETVLRLITKYKVVSPCK